MNERQERILKIVNDVGEISFQELKEEINEVSEMTIRNDLKLLDNNNLIIRIHGGAKSINKVLLNKELINKRIVKNKKEKMQIALKATQLIKENSSIFIDSGSTMIAFSKVIPDIECLIFTTGIHCALELSKLKKAKIYLIGGRLNCPTMSIAGSTSCEMVKRNHYDIAFVGASGYTSKYGFNCGESEERELKAMAIKQSDLSVILMDSSKIGLNNTFSFADLGDIDIIVTDDNISNINKKKITAPNLKIM